MKVKDVDALREQISEDPREAFTKHQVWLFASIHNKTVPTIEAIPKNDVVAMLSDLQLEVEECVDGAEGSPEFEQGVANARVQVVKMIQERINDLTSKSEMEEDGNNTE